MLLPHCFRTASALLPHCCALLPPTVLMLLCVRGTWREPTKKQGRKPEEVLFKAVIMFFDGGDGKRLTLPDNVIAKLTEYEFCLFDKEEQPSIVI